MEGLSLDALPQVAAGTLHYQAILRLFGGGAPQEMKRVGSVTVTLDGSARKLVHKLTDPMKFAVSTNDSSAKCTFEIELSWRAGPGSPSLALASIPVPLMALD